MKKLTIVIALIAVIVIIGFGYNTLSINSQQKLAKETFQTQVGQKWAKVITCYDLIAKNCSTAKSYKDFAYSHYKDLQDVEKFKIPVKFVDNFKADIALFGTQVAYPTKDLFDVMSQDMTKDPEQLKDIKKQVVEFEKNLNRYWGDHYKDYELSVVPRRSDEINQKLVKLYAPPKPIPTKVVFVQGYPSWVSSDIQRQTYSRMADIVRRYFAARSTLQKQIDWKYGSQNWSYFSNSNVQSVLLDAINLRKDMFTEVQQTKQVEGMSTLASLLEDMLKNSYAGLLRLYSNQDYGAFKELNNRNDAISRDVRRNFGIR